MSNNNAFKGNNNVCPIGSIIYWAGKTALKEVVENFIPADGRSLEQADYPQLFSSLGTRYGTGSGTTTFSLPDPTGQLLVAGAAADAGATVAPSRTAFATATFSIDDQTFLPPFSMDYDTAAPYAGTNNYYKDGVGNESLYTKSSTQTRNPGGDLFCRDDITYTNDGGIGLQEMNPQIIFDNGVPAPVDITADIVAPASYNAPTFNIIAMIKVRN
jgi:microcystin-dependent protein